MIRAAFGIIGLFFYMAGRMMVIFCKSITVQLIVLAIILYSITGCAAIIEHDARTCHRDAWTISAMQACNDQYAQHLGTVTDTIAQPLGKLESMIQHKGHNH